jgi:hypothetical protein
MANFTSEERLFNQLFNDLNDVFNHNTILSNYGTKLDFERYEDVNDFFYYYVRKYIVNTYGFGPNDPITDKLRNEWVRKNYSDGNMPIIGDTIEMVYMDDTYPIPPGTKGKVVGYTSLKSPFNEDHMDVDWENGRSLSLITGVDKVRVIHKI